MDKMSTYECTKCGTHTPYEPRIVNGTEYFRPRLCKTCAEAEANTLRLKRTAAEDAERVAAWDKICPPAYQKTDPAHPMMRGSYLKAVTSWRPRDGRGLGLWSPESGLGKTRMMFLLLKRLHFEDKLAVVAVSAKRLAKLYATMFADTPEGDFARGFVRSTRKCDVLFVDDLAKEKLTDHAQAEFYDLVETRTSNERPILWTANTSGDELAARLSKDRGGPIVRRLQEFTEVIQVIE